jgi:ABC-type Fe3+-citrate transport system substrate-binding protein
MSDELKIVLEDVKEKFDTVIEAFNMVSERLDRHEQAEEERLERIESRLIELGHDLNEHRNNTELHGQRKERAS